MNLSGVENKARLALALSVVALLLTVSLSLALHAQARRDLESQRLLQARTEAALLAAALDRGGTLPTDIALATALQRHEILGAAAVFTNDGGLTASASAMDRVPDWPRLYERANLSSAGDSQSTASKRPRLIATGDENLTVVEAPLGAAGVLILAKPPDSALAPITVYVLSYQIVALVLGLGLIFVMVRWLLRPYRRMVEAARGSPVRPQASRSESEFVVETFQALIDQLQSKEKELALLHELERNRADRSERFSERLISSIPSGLVSVDSRGLVTSANAQTTEIFGPFTDGGRNGDPTIKATPDGTHYREFFQSAPQMLEMISTCLARGTPFRREEVDVANADGRSRHLGLSISPIIDSTHNVEGALCLMTDITEVIDLRERMKLQENLANLGEMAAGLAHEFKNSLATIQGYIQLVEARGGSSKDDDGFSALSSTLNEVRVLNKLVTDFLNFSRPQQLNLGDIDLRELLESCIEENRVMLCDRRIEVTVEGSFADVTGDDSLLSRAFANLIRNAAEAFDEQSPRREIRIVGTRDHGSAPRHVHVRISDTGRGILPQDLPRIFIPFFTTKSRGYGIGLALVQKIFVAHGGDVAVEKSDSEGTVFHCRLVASREG
jgi:signal transduction histidine kinase/type II secretory pathway pseudopilin PulG